MENKRTFLCILRNVRICLTKIYSIHIRLDSFYLMKSSSKNSLEFLKTSNFLTLKYGKLLSLTTLCQASLSYWKVKISWNYTHTTIPWNKFLFLRYQTVNTTNEILDSLNTILSSHPESTTLCWKNHKTKIKFLTSNSKKPIILLSNTFRTMQS